MPIQPYLFFEGRCEEAAGFYRDALDAEIVMLVRYGDSPVPPQPGKVPPGSEDKILHLTLRIGDAEIFASDGFASGTPEFKGFALSHTLANAALCEQAFARLAEGGQVHMPLAQTFFAPLFGMVVDGFGVMWMLQVAAPPAPATAP